MGYTKINSYNTFDPIKEIILGDVDYSVINFCEPNQKQRLTHIFNKTQKELNAIQTQLESLGIKVHRPNKIKNTEVKTPYWTSDCTRIPLSPRDVILIMGDTIIETAPWMKERTFETYYYRDTFLHYVNNGSKWITMPLPRYDYEGINVPNSDTNEVINQDPILDGASVLKYGKDIFFSGGTSHNKLGEQWLKNNFPNYRYHNLDKTFIGHLDAHLNIIRPGLLYTYHHKDKLPEYFQNWDIISASPEQDKNLMKQQILIDDKIQDDDFENTVLCINSLVINPNTIMIPDFYKSNVELMKQFEKNKVDVVFTTLSYQHFFGQGLTCMTLELSRETDGLIDYTK